jgi:flagellin
MVIGIGGLNAAQSQQSTQRANNKLQTAIASLISGTRINRAADDVASLSIATQLQSEVSSLKQASANIAQAVSLAQVADGGAEQIDAQVQELRQLATRAASPLITGEVRESLNKQLQEGLQEIDRLASNTRFNGKNLLDGSLNGDDGLSLTKLLGAGESLDSAALTVPSLTRDALLEGQSLSLLTADGAARAADLLGNAREKIAGARASIGAFAQNLNYAGASIDSAIANQEAARAILQDADFAEAANESSLATILRNASLAVQAQGNRLSPNLIKLVG